MTMATLSSFVQHINFNEHAYIDTQIAISFLLHYVYHGYGQFVCTLYGSHSSIGINIACRAQFKWQITLENVYGYRIKL